VIAVLVWVSSSWRSQNAFDLGKRKPHTSASAIVVMYLTEFNFQQSHYVCVSSLSFESALSACLSVTGEQRTQSRIGIRAAKLRLTFREGRLSMCGHVGLVPIACRRILMSEQR